MATETRTVSVRLDPDAGKRLDKASALMRQSRGGFLEKAGDEAARRVLLEWTARRYRQGGGTFSELAQESGLAVEEIMEHLGDEERSAAMEMFLASSRTVAEAQNDPAFLEMAQQAVASLTRPDVPDVRAHGTGLTLRETPASYTAAAPVAWRRDGDRLSLRGASDNQRATMERLVRELSAVRGGGRGGSAALAAELAGELEAGFLTRATVEWLSQWCHSQGPGYRGRAQRAARAVSEALFGRVIPALPRGDAGDAAWRELGTQATD